MLFHNNTMDELIFTFYIIYKCQMSITQQNMSSISIVFNDDLHIRLLFTITKYI